MIIQDPSEPNRPWNSHIVIDSEGTTKALYNKLHLFDLEIPGKVRLMESEFSKSGTKMVSPVDTPIGRLGLSICYDLRFSELALWNRTKGAEILSYPSSFTLNTGLAHWEPLLRTRAIETQCYVVAAAQTGKHNEKRISYGHSMVVDPWGAIIAQCSERIDMCFAEIDLSYVAELRKMQPVFAHRRSDLYMLHANEEDSGTRPHSSWCCTSSNVISIIKTSENSSLMFAEFPIAAESIFYKSAHSFAFVNLKPVLNGHVLVCPKRVCYHLTDLTDAETADLFIVAKKVQRMIEKHVHVHILARREGDFGGSPDNLYSSLATHDRYVH
ncbi:unnamed protein product [Haemonchus placei]|uniref:CN hydrolase domain-containing protein n=1 Tax=Haemonchus placei TaxID=6290 RepID=A0A3P7VX88_HAEPC|nr:unnamed protein product [Haemonchus placei]